METRGTDARLILALAVLSACGGVPGEGVVEARFLRAECPEGRSRSRLEDYAWAPAYMATDRFSGVLVISLLEHSVQVEETDGLAMRIDLDRLIEEGRLALDRERARIVRASDAPLDLLVTEGPEGASAILSLFQTCPLHPAHHAVSGRLSLTRFTLAEDPLDTGERERIAGTLTATIARADTRGPVGTIVAVFDFAPPRRPLATFK